MVLLITPWAAHRFLAKLSPGGVPTWDLRLPDDAPHYHDTSTGAIAASGMLLLAELVTAPEHDELQGAALSLPDALVVRCFETDPEAQGLLRGGTYHAHKGWGVEEFFICGDYFFWMPCWLLREKRQSFGEKKKHGENSQ